MRIPAGAHLGYCTNIHPGESLEEVVGNLRTHVAAVKARVAPNEDFGVGLRLSNRAAVELETDDALARFADLLDELGFYVFTINGFPYGPFHGQPVKENVYRPDWLEEERVAYSDRLARILATLLPRGPAERGSISTVPGCFRPRAEGPDAFALMAVNVARHAATLHAIAASGGPAIALALEPEPHCACETTLEAVAFVAKYVHAGPGLEAFVRATGLSGGAAEEALHDHVGLCLDACHAAVEYESPADALAAARRAGVRIAKLQVSAGLRIAPPSPEARAALEPYAEGVYLHQTVIRRGDRLERILDLPDALAATADPGDEWRVHFHVPVFRDSIPPFASTRATLEELLALQAAQPFSDHIEVETYTWDVLPPELRAEPVDAAIARELAWTRQELTRR